MINWIAPTLCPPNKVVYATFFDGELNVQVIEKNYIETWITSNLIEDLESIDGILGTETWHVLRTEKFNYMWEGETIGRGPGDDGSAPPADGPAS